MVVMAPTFLAIISLTNSGMDFFICSGCKMVEMKTAVLCVLNHMLLHQQSFISVNGAEGEGTQKLSLWI
jgi:hypothetical protein